RTEEQPSSKVGTWRWPLCNDCRMESLGRRVRGPLPRASRAAHVAPRVLAALESRAPLTVLRGPRGYGKTTALVHWLTAGEAEVRTLYVALDATARLTPGFWLALHDALMAAELDVDLATAESLTGEEAEPEQAAVVQAQLRVEEPLRLVLDNFHEAGLLEGRNEIDEELLELVRTSSSLELVVATRALRSLETIG